MKICIKCGEEKEENIDNFRLVKKTNKYRNFCLVCDKKRNREYYIANKPAIRARNKKTYENNKEAVAIYNKNYCIQNKEKLKEQHFNYYQDNKVILKEKQIIYNENNKEQRKSSQKNSSKIRRNSDPAFRLRGIISTRVGKALHAAGSSKKLKSILDFLPYTIPQLKDHLEKLFEPWMNWTNHGIHNKKEYDETNSSTWKWNIDHIIPHSSLLYISMEDKNFQKCWALENLRPLLAKKNIEDGNRR
jgi:hypothetical protein